MALKIPPQRRSHRDKQQRRRRPAKGRNKQATADQLRQDRRPEIEQQRKSEPQNRHHDRRNPQYLTLLPFQPRGWSFRDELGNRCLKAGCRERNQ
ncbi:hypothetical protein D3C74_331860 [compost metagenome]